MEEGRGTYYLIQASCSSAAVSKVISLASLIQSSGSSGVGLNFASGVVLGYVNEFERRYLSSLAPERGGRLMFAGGLPAPPRE